MTKTIVGKALVEPKLSILNERISEIVGLTSDYFNCWRSHASFAKDDEPAIMPDTIYTFPKGPLSVNVTNSIKVMPETMPSRTGAFYDFRYVKPVISEDGHPAIRILVNGIFAGYYLSDINTLVLSDWTHDRSCISVFNELWPQLITELGLMPFEESKIKKIFPEEILVGADPEFELIQDGEVLEADETLYMSDRYHSPIGTDGAGSQIELRPQPGNPIKVTQNIRNLLEQFSMQNSNMNLGTTGNQFPLGGHIHIGVGLPVQPNKDLVTLLDDFIGKPTINLSGEAREDYKRLSAVRQQPHGFEYRTCPAAVFQDPGITTIVLKLARNLVKNYIYEKTMVYHSNPTVDEYVQIGGLTRQQAKYFKKFCDGFRPTNCLSETWKLQKTRHWHDVEITFENVWADSAKSYINSRLRNIKVKKPLSLTLYGLGEKKYGQRSCTIAVPSFRQVIGPRTSDHEIGVSYDVRTGESAYTHSTLVNAIKNHIGGN